MCWTSACKVTRGCWNLWADIEGSAAGGMAVNERQLKRLRGVLNPFMLRRVKADVASEMVAKHEATIFCEPSPRQQVPPPSPGFLLYLFCQKLSHLVKDLRCLRWNAPSPKVVTAHSFAQFFL